ncbi:MAG: hypothetical protein HUU29_04960, partial [Planctomycetaceae bacterium]|nr:hypothetical protein [Planctomycetaceae bacterium]
MKRAALFVACLLLCIIGLSVVPVEAKKILPGPGMVSLSIHLNSPTGPTIDSYLHFKMSNFAYDMIPYDEGGLVSRTLYAVNNSTGNITIGPLTAMHGFPNMTFSGGNVVLAPNQNTPFQFTITPNEIGRFWEMFSFTHNAPNLTSPLTLTTDPKVVPKPEANPCVCCNCLAAMNNASIFTHSKEPAMYDVKLASGSHITGFPILDLGEKTDDVSYNLGPCPPGESWTPGGMGSGSAYIIYHRCDPLACPDNMESGFLGENMRDNFDMAIFQDDGVRGRVMTPDMRQYLITRPSGSSQWDLPDGFFSDLTLNTGTSEWELRHYSGTTYYFDAPGPMMGEGRLKRITDAVGNTTTVNRNANGEKISIVNDLGRAITFTHTGGRITTITDFLNVGFSRRWDFAYDGNGNLQTITYPQAETVTNAGGTATIAAGVLVHDADGASATSIATVGGTPLAITATYRRRLTLLHGSGALNKHLTGVTDDRGATPWTASYNATTGRIVTKTINGNLVRFYFEGDTIPAQYVPDAIGGADFLGKLESTNSWTRIVDREENICDWEIHGATGNPVNGEGKFGTRRKICWTERGKTNGTTVLHSETLISGGAAEPNFWETRYFHDCNCLAPAQLTQAYRSDQAVSYDANQMPTNYPREVLVYNDNRQILDYRYKGFLASEEIHWSATYRSSDGRMETYTPPRDDDTNPIYSGLSFTHNYGYDGEGNLNSHTFPPVNTGPASGETASESWVFNGDGQMTSHTDENGNITLYTYDTNAGDDPAPTNVNQSGVTFVGFLISTTAGASGSVDTVTNLVTQYKVNALGWTTRMTDPKGFNHTMIYNNLGEVIRRDEPTVTLPETGTTSTYATHFFHDGAGNMVMSARTNEDFNDTARPNPFLNASAAFNVVNNVTMSRVEVDASAANDLTTEYAYDKNDQQTIVRLPEGNRTFVLFDERRLPFKTFYGVEPGIAINTGYPTLKTATTLTVNFVGLSRPTWDARYNTIRVRDGRGNFSDSFPDFYNRTLATRDANGNGSRFEFDDDSLTLTTSSGQISTSGAITSTLERTYHRFDERQRRYQTVLDFDLGNNEFNFSDPSTGTGSVNSNYLTEFDPGSRVMTSLDANGNPTDYVYDAADRTREVTDALVDKVIYTLDLNSNVTEIRE